MLDQFSGGRALPFSLSSQYLQHLYSHRRETHNSKFLPIVILILMFGYHRRWMIAWRKGGKLQVDNTRLKLRWSSWNKYRPRISSCFAWVLAWWRMLLYSFVVNDTRLAVWRYKYIGRQALIFVTSLQSTCWQTEVVLSSKDSLVLGPQQIELQLHVETSGGAWRKGLLEEVRKLRNMRSRAYSWTINMFLKHSQIMGKWSYEWLTYATIISWHTFGLPWYSSYLHD